MDMRWTIFSCLFALATVTTGDPCAGHSKCRDYWKKTLGMDSLPKYDEGSYPEVGEWMCLNTVGCPVERAKFCEIHQNDGHELIKETCEDWARSGFN